MVNMKQGGNRRATGPASSRQDFALPESASVFPVVLGCYATDLIWTGLRGQRERLGMNVCFSLTKWIPTRRNG
jgi:hypothetical protein